MNSADPRLTSVLRPESVGGMPMDGEAPLSKKRLRIALFSGNYNCVRDGANRALNRLVAHLLGRGHDVRVYSPVAPVAAFPGEGTLIAAPSLAIPGRPEYRLALGFTRGLRRDVEAFAPDIIHLSAPDLLGEQARRYGVAHGIPVVASLHTRFETYMDYYGMRRLRALVERYLRHFYSGCDLVLAPTAPIAEDLQSWCDPSRISIWGRGVDPASFSPAFRDKELRLRMGAPGNEIVPLFFGRLVKEKGLDLFAQIISRIREQGFSVRPAIIGDGPYRSTLARQLPNATFLGHLDGDHLGRAVASADLLINPSLTEAFGNVNLEAMASGLAIVAADIPASSFLLTHGQNALLAKPTDVGSYADCAVRILRDDVLRSRLRKEALVESRKWRWTTLLDQVLSKYQDIYSEMQPRLRGEDR